ncbi:TetR/AcrR family transcriptional regulator [Erythrobacter sp. W302b]|uniref:TetR/AcrR family transcriptional regulator n=1 Tax=Erythrobacter sp. W302b TaxID=3389874 RepID=UPI00396B21F9
MTAQHLFHVRGYDAVSIAELTAALGINPPSFYAAFGSKAALFHRVLDRWAGSGAIPLTDMLQPDRPAAEALSALLEAAARRYAADPAATGCLVLEGTRCDDPEARRAALSFNQAGEAVIREYIKARHPEEAQRLADFVSTTMSGLSAKARHGHSLEQLLATARLAALAIEQALSDQLRTVTKRNPQQ